MTNRNTLWQEVKKNRVYYGLILPSLVFAAAVIFYPIFYAIDLSVHNTVFLKKTNFIGLTHFLNFLNDTEGLRNVVNSFVFVFGSLLLAMPIGLGLALAVNEKIRFRAFFRLLLILPWVISQVVTALLWSWMLNPQFGVSVLVTNLFGIPPVNFLGEQSTAMITLILVNVWRTFPFAMLLSLAALQTIPEQLYEAARVDGAGAFQRLIHVTFPLIKPTLMITIIILSLAYFNYIDLPFILTGGGPLGETEVLTLRVYREAFSFNKLGFGSAIAIIVFVINIVLSLLYIKVLRSERY